MSATKGEGGVNLKIADKRVEHRAPVPLDYCTGKAWPASYNG